MGKIIISGFYDEVSQNLDEQIKAMQSYNENYMCPRVINGKNIADYTVEEFKSNILPILEKNKIKFSSIGSPIGKIDLYDKEAYKKQLKKLKNLIEICKIIDCKYIRIFSFYVKTDYNNAESLVIEKLNNFLKLVDGTDIILLHENEKEIFGDIPSRVLKLNEKIKNKHFGFIFDASNFIQCGIDSKTAYDQLKEIIVYYHIKDCDMVTKVEMPLLTGDGEYRYILSDLANRGYEGFMTLEPHTAMYAKTKNIIFIKYFLSLFIKKSFIKTYKKINMIKNIKTFEKVTEKKVFDWQYYALVDELSNLGLYNKQ